MSNTEASAKPQITVVKNDHAGHEILRYHGRVLLRETRMVKLEAEFSRGDVQTSYHLFRKGDRFIEWYFSDRWYNIFEMHDRDDDRLKGWYCNITRPAAFSDELIEADDLALDVFIAPSGEVRVLDEEEFASLPLDEATRINARRGVNDILRLVEERQAPFNQIEAPGD